MKRAAEIVESEIIIPPKFENSGSSREIAQAGLRILARIIAREAVRERPAKTNTLKPDSSSSEASPAEVSIHV
jgi:hypothetical protein